jgi:hypothetical protein
MDKEKEAHNSLMFQINDLKLQKEVLRSQSFTFKNALDTCKKTNNDLVDRNNKLSVKNSELKKMVQNYRVALGVSIIILVAETIALVNIWR